MTAQVHDRVQWNDGDYLLVGVEGDRLFDPSEHGLQTVATTTANWRGCVVHYAVRDEHLVVAELRDVGLAIGPDDAPPTLRGTQAVREGAISFRYPHLDWPLDFTGRVIVARGFIQALYRHMGFHPAWKFEESWELTFDEGALTDATDLSHDMQSLRADIDSGKVSDPDGESRPGWIARTFRLGFGRSKLDRD